ncbi:MAG: Holliday junction branch migration protein RuvA [Lacunisphaera sp.]|nr:Holliday junction branch migration protein RuvA [Lacunisphaera sp.]
MITRISGTLVAATPLTAIIETGGLGYEVHIPLTTAERLPSPGQSVKLHTLAVYRDDSQTLYGFADDEERDFFRLLIEKVSGVGPKMALSVLSKLSLATLKGAIAAGDVTLLATCPGIGRKTAERLVIELRDKLTPAEMGRLGSVRTELGQTGPARAENKIRDAVLALTALGYKAADADKAVRKAWVGLGPAASTEALIKKALG